MSTESFEYYKKHVELAWVPKGWKSARVRLDDRQGGVRITKKMLQRLIDGGVVEIDPSAGVAFGEVHYRRKATK